ELPRRGHPGRRHARPHVVVGQGTAGGAAGPRYRDRRLQHVQQLGHARGREALMSTSLYEAPGVLVEFESPDVFHEIPLHLPADALDAQVSELAARIWPGGTDFQREATAAVYREVAGSLDADGVLHAALGLFATEDDRISTANLLVRIEETEPGDPG